MNNQALKTLILILASLAAIGCAGVEEVNDDELVAEQDQEVDPGEQQVGDEAPPVDEEPPADEEPPVDEELPIDDEPFCGDGVQDDGEACDDGNGDDGDGCSSECALEPLTTEGSLVVNVILDDLDAPTPPVQDACSAFIPLTLDGTSLTGEARCFLQVNANFFDVEVDATVDAFGNVTGEIDIVLNGGSNVVDLNGVLNDDVLALDIDGVTTVIGSIRGLWSGTIDAEFE